jgi:NADH-quinone oxidoreductase subunit J
MGVDPVSTGMVQWILFIVLGGLALFLALGMTLTMSMYRAGLALMGSFLALAGLFFMLGADLLGLVQIMMNVAGMAVMVLFMVMLMMDPGGEMMWDMARQMKMPGLGALKMGMPRGGPADEALREPDDERTPSAGGVMAPQTVYTCPMHPEVERTSPGKCPKCGMELEPKAGTAAQPAPQQPKPAPAAHEQAWLELRLDPSSLVYRGRPLSEWLDRVDALWNERESGGGGGSGAPPPERERGHHHGEPSHEKDSGHHKMMVDMAMSTAQVPWALAVSALTGILIAVIVARPVWPVAAMQPVKDAVVEVGTLLLSKYMIAFEGAALLILAGIVTAVMLGRREKEDRSSATPATPAVLDSERG